MAATESGKQAVFAAFYERHWKFVYRLAFSYLKNATDAEDCTEDVFLKVYTGDQAFEDETHERKWLTVTVINQCKDRLKSWHHREVDSIDEEDAPEIAAPVKDDNSDVLEAVKKLPEKLKDVIMLYYYVGYKTEEIAQMLGRPPSTVRNQLKDARELLKKELERSM